MKQQMIRSYTMRLKVTQRQSASLSTLLSHLCELYNAALQERRDAWKVCRKSVGLYDQMAELTQLRAVDTESSSFPAAIQRDPLRRVDHAFKSFFRRCKAGQFPGFPRFRSQDRYASFTVDAQNFYIEGDRIVIVKLGGFGFRTRCRIKGQPRSVCISRRGSRWQAIVACEIGAAPKKRPVSNAVGIDVGLATLATLSNGTEIENPRWTKREQDRLASANRNLVRKKRGSKNRARALERLRRVYQRIQGLRRNYLHSISNQLVANYDLIAFEDLNIRGMVQSRLAKSIMDVAWGELIRQLIYKAEEAGVWAVPVNPGGTSQMCSRCGVEVPKRLAERWHKCSCGLSLSRDHNAALNVLRLGESLVETRQNIQRMIADKR